jgi:hypothetical protein
MNRIGVAASWRGIGDRRSQKVLNLVFAPAYPKANHGLLTATIEIPPVFVDGLLVTLLFQMSRETLYGSSIRASSPGLRLPDDRAERDRGADPPQRHARDPDDR